MATHLKRAPAAMNLFHFYAIWTVSMFWVVIRISATRLPALSPENILSLSKDQCVVAIVEPNGNGPKQTTKNSDFADLLAIADVAFKRETKIFAGTIDLERFVWPNGKKLELNIDAHKIKAVLFPRLQEDRTCLQKPLHRILYPKAFGYSNLLSKASFGDPFWEFVNQHCNTFRKPDGNLNVQGLHREYMLENLFSVKELPSYVTISTLVKNQNQNSDSCYKDAGTGNNKCPELRKERSYLQHNNVPNCERIPVPSKENFINNYLTRSKPVIITGAMEHWPAITKWTNEFLRQQYGQNEVHVKLTPKGEYEGIESADIWETHGTFKIPPAVLKELPYPDLVVVRPAGIGMNFSKFLDLIEKISEGTYSNISAYLEYTSVADYFPELEKDLAEMEFFENVLKLAHLNIWLSDGNTLGKAHFDPFDNFLCQFSQGGVTTLRTIRTCYTTPAMQMLDQLHNPMRCVRPRISGEKEVMLFEPRSDFLYEAHIPEAILSYNSTLKQFRRSTLLDSTSMVMTPVDILNPHLGRFPKFGSARPLSCTIREGEVLFMPAFWWHEVQSRPSRTQHRNLAVNFWYDPFFVKEFPCPECGLDVNPKYNHLL